MAPVTIAVISTAEIAKAKVVPALLAVPSAELVGVSSRDKGRAQAFVDEHVPRSEDDGEDDGAPRCVGMTHDEVCSVAEQQTTPRSRNPSSTSPRSAMYHSKRTKVMEEKLFRDKILGKVKRVSASFTWGGGGLVDEAWVEGGNGRTDPKREAMGMLGDR